jgi:hypothetical protein
MNPASLWACQSRNAKWTESIHLDEFRHEFPAKKLASVQITGVNDELVELCSQKVINKMRRFIFRRYSLVLEDQV